MVNFVLVQFLSILFIVSASAKVDRIHAQGYLGEKRLDSYSERYYPLVNHDMYQGKMSFQDEEYFQNYFSPYLFQSEKDLSFFIRSELNGGLSCPNELLSQHFEEIQYSYRLITLSYLIEAQWQMKMFSDHFRMKSTCSFDLGKWAQTCRPKSEPMKKFIERLSQYSPRYEEYLPPSYKKEDWWKEFITLKGQTYSHYKFRSDCKGKCSESDLAGKFQSICSENQRTMDLICSEIDELYGLTGNRDAYQLLAVSNIINTYNKQGEALGCLRRFSEVMGHKEVRYKALAQLFPALKTQLRQKYEERFLQGRVFFFGASKEFENKGLSNIYVKEQKLKIESAAKELEIEEPPVLKPVAVVVPEKKPAPLPEVVAPKRKEIIEVKQPNKSAFLQAAEIRISSNLEQVEVDMLKLKYDYVFTLNMLNALSEKLKTFMTREALTEMMAYDRLGSKEGPVPLLFIKFMIDMEEHHGLWNLISVLGEKFYVSNEIDASFKPVPELVALRNNETTGRQWQLFIVRP
jgi:hypothetical protein